MTAFSAARRELVVARAGGRCEYCHLPARGQVATFPIDHIVPKSAGGTTALDNLALSCTHCNSHKWATADATDPGTGLPAGLFHPRRDAWDDHFRWSAEVPGRLDGLTAVGRATLAALRANHPDMVELRQILGGVGLFPEVAAAMPPL